MKSFHSFLFAGAAALLMTGCSSAVSPEKAAQIDPAKTGLVLATVAESGVKDSWAQFTLHSLDGHDSSFQHRAIDTTKELWLLEVPPGRYRIAGWNVAGSVQPTGSGTPAATQEFEFEVRPGEVTYLGHFVVAGKLVVDASSKQRVFVWDRPVLEDRSQAAFETFRQQYPALAAMPVRSVAPQQIELLPTVAGQIAWNTSAGQDYPGNSKQNESGSESMPSGPRWP